MTTAATKETEITLIGDPARREFVTRGIVDEVAAADVTTDELSLGLSKELKRRIGRPLHESEFNVRSFVKRKDDKRFLVHFVLSIATDECTLTRGIMLVKPSHYAGGPAFFATMFTERDSPALYNDWIYHVFITNKDGWVRMRRGD